MQIIDIGTAPNDGTGDTLRDAFDKTNENFDSLKTLADLIYAGQGLQGIPGPASSGYTLLSSYGTGTLAEMVATVGSTKITVGVDVDTSVAVSLTIPTNIDLLVLNESVITIATNQTLTINGPFSAGLCQVFAGAGFVDFGGGSSLTVAPDWWDADIAPAIAALGSTPANLIINSPITCTTDQTIPATTAVSVHPTGSLTITTGKTLTINGSFNSGCYQCIAGAGVVAFGGADFVRPEWWGALSDGVTDCAAAFTAAMACITASSVVEWLHHVTPKFRTGAGKYLISSKVTTPNTFVWEGYNTEIVISAGVTAFETVTGFITTRISGVHYFGGAVAFAYDPATNDTRMVDLNNCIFQEQTAHCIKPTQTTTANGIQITIEKCKFVNVDDTNTTLVMIENYTDKMLIRDCWMSTYSDIAIINRSTLFIDGLLWSPYVGGKTVVQNYGYVLDITNSRFGSENGGSLLLDNRYSGIWTVNSGTISVHIHHNTIYPGSNYLAKFYALPNSLTITNNFGAPTCAGIYFDATIPANDVAYFSTANYLEYGNNTPQLTRFRGDDTKFTCLAQPKITESLGTADIVAISQSESASQSATQANGIADVDHFGNPVSKYTSTGDSSSLSVVWGTLASTLTNGQQYTATINVNIGPGNAVFAEPYVYATGQTIGGLAVIPKTAGITLGEGKHVVNFTFTKRAGDAQIGINLYTFSGWVSVGLVRVYTGAINITKQHAEVYADALPTTGQWWKGDRIIQIVPTVEGQGAWACSVTGDYAEGGTDPTWVLV